MSDETADPAERPTVTCQTAFGADGTPEPAQSSVETSLTD